MRTISYLLVGLLIGGSIAAAMAQPIVTESTSKAETTVKSPPPSAISPNVTTINNVMCKGGVSAAIQTQILGFSAGSTFTDLNCEMVILSRELSSLQMKAPAAALLCQDARVWWSMWDGGVPCPIEGKINVEAKNHWLANPQLIPDRPKIR